MYGQHVDNWLIVGSATSMATAMPTFSGATPPATSDLVDERHTIMQPPILGNVPTAWASSAPAISTATARATFSGATPRRHRDLVHERHADPAASRSRQCATNWSVVGTGDFNGDGTSDILWHDIAGDVGIWLMNGTLILQGL